jgi:hypothetical protein
LNLEGSQHRLLAHSVRRIIHCEEKALSGTLKGSIGSIGGAIGVCQKKTPETSKAPFQFRTTHVNLQLPKE